MSALSGFTVETPTRIDLAGGTLDLFPLYLFEEGSVTVNAAISIMSRVTVEPREDSAVVLCASDIGEEVTAPSPQDVPVTGPLELVGRAVRQYAPPCGVTITTHSAAPHGSGLGASSSLLMALSVALTRLRGEDRPFPELIEVGANLETQVLGIPAGKQDFFPPLYGGVAALEFGVDAPTRTELCHSAAAREHLEAHLVLSFTGVPHFSGSSNWEMLRNYVEDAAGTRPAMARIRDTAQGMAACLAAEDWDRLPGLLAEEWANRRSLAPGVTTPEVDAIMAAADDAGALANKLCGAGGGGCMVTYAPPERRAAVEAAVCANGARVLPYRIVPEGVRVRESVTN